MKTRRLWIQFTSLFLIMSSSGADELTTASLQLWMSSKTTREGYTLRSDLRSWEAARRGCGRQIREGELPLACFEQAFLRTGLGQRGVSLSVGPLPRGSSCTKSVRRETSIDKLEALIALKEVVPAKCRKMAEERRQDLIYIYRGGF